MDQREVFDRLNRVFRDVFDDETIRVTPNTTADDIDDLCCKTSILIRGKEQ